MSNLKVAAIGGLICLLCACSEKLEGPTPVLADGSAALPADPAYACRTRDETIVAINGADFAPVVVGIPNSTRAALPEIQFTRAAALDGTTTDVETSVRFSGQPDGVNADQVTWVDQTRMTVRFSPDVEVTTSGETSADAPLAGLYDVQVQNSGERVGAFAGALALVEPPALSATTPGIVCVAQGERDVELTGLHLLSVDGAEPRVGVGEAELPVASLSDCTDVAHPLVPGKTCTGAKITVATDGLPNGLLRVEARNPEPAACQSPDPVSLRVVPPPVIERVEPPVACVAEMPREVTIHGADILRVDGEPPAVTMTDAGGVDVALEVLSLDGCEPLETQGHEVERCAAIVVVIPQRPAEDPFLPTLTVKNPAPAGCDVATSTGLMLVPPPVIDTVEPPLACTAQGTRDATVRGAGFLRVDGEATAFTLDGAEVALTELVDCEALPVEGLSVDRCATATVVLPEGVPDVAPGDFAQPPLRAVNPQPAGCSVEVTGPITITPPPALTALEPALACVAQGERAVRLSGAGFVIAGGAEPAVVAGDQSLAASFESCAAVPVAGLETELCDVAVLTVDDSIAVGVHSVSMTNPDPAGCTAPDPLDLRVVPPPTLEAADPPVLCTVEGPRQVVLRGQDLLGVGDALPQVSMTAGNGDVVALEVLGLAGECEPLPSTGLDVRRCTELTVVVPPAALDAAYQPMITVTNPAPAGCLAQSAELLTLVPAPSVAAVDPPITCTAAAPQMVTLQGAGFLRFAGAAPAVSATDASGAMRALQVMDALGCEPVPGAPDLERCSALQVEIPAEQVAAAYAPEFTVVNPDPAGCAATHGGGLLIVPEPTLVVGRPAVVCDGDQAELVIEGTGFLSIDGAGPAVSLNGDPPAVGVLDGCEALPVQGAQVLSCTTVRLPIDAAGAGGDVDVTLNQPAPVECSVTGVQTLALITPPRIDTAEPSLVCTDDGARTLQLTGDGFLDFDGALPTVEIGEERFPATGVADCADDNAGGLAWRNCRTLDFEVPRGSLAAGTPDIAVVGPAPAACRTAAPGLLTVPPPLTLVDVVPERACLADGDRVVRLVGTGFLELDGVSPTLRFGELEVEPDSLEGCEPIAGPGFAGQVCTGMTVTLAQDSLPFGLTPVAVINPAPSSCEEVVADEFYVIPLPEIAGVEPDEVCEDDNHRFTITGRNFIPESAVTLGDVAADTIEFVDENTLVVTFGPVFEPGLYDLTVDNGDGCVDSAPEAVRVHPTPIVFFVDPTVVYNGINLQATIFTSGLDAPPASVTLLGPNDEEIELDPIIQGVRFNRILATIPAGLAVGEWGVQVVSRIGCIGAVDGAVQVTDDLRVDITRVDPAFASPTRPTGVTIQSADGFLSTPRAYLNPTGAAPGVLATALRAVVFVDPARLTAIVPDGLVPGAYDLIVVNPDASVGLLEAAITVTVGEPPVVVVVEPASLDGNGPQEARVFGADFDADGGVTLALSCKDPADGSVRSEPAQVVDGTLTETEVTGVFPADLFDAGSVCLVVLTNADGASFSYSAVSIKTPAQNLNAWAAQPDMLEARRAPALVAGRPTTTSRFLYAIGGDEGDGTAAKRSVESVGVDVFGDMSEWTAQRHALPAPRTLAGAARVGGFVFVVGGSDGQTATDTVFRAQVLDPLAGPQVVDVSLTLDREVPDGLGGGLWHYRVSAVFPPDDALNPDGESLPGETLVADLPVLPGLRLQLDWSPVMGASGYRVYRTAQAEDPADAVVLLAEVAADQTSLIDDGRDTIAEDAPLPSGSLGVWHSVGQLTTPRQAASVVAAPAPEAEGPDITYLYAAGGRDADGNYLSSYEVARITDGGLTVAPFQVGAQPLGTARAEGAAFLVTDVDTQAVPAGERWVFFGPGRTAAGFARAVEAGQVTAGGQLAALISTDGTNADVAGYGAGAANGFLFVFGGRGGLPTDGGISGELCLPGQGGCNAAPPEPPDIRNWNNLGVRTTVPRAYPGYTQESAFFFLVGGVGLNGPTQSTESTVQ